MPHSDSQTTKDSHDDTTAHSRQPELHRTNCNGRGTFTRAFNAQMVQTNGFMQRLCSWYTQAAVGCPRLAPADAELNDGSWIHETISSRTHSYRRRTVITGGKTSHGVEDAGPGVILVPPRRLAVSREDGEGRAWIWKPQTRSVRARRSREVAAGGHFPTEPPAAADWTR